MNSYFTTTPLHKWSSERCNEYLSKKYSITIQADQTQQSHPVTSDTPQVYPVTPQVYPVTPQVYPVTPQVYPVTPQVYPVTPQVYDGKWFTTSKLKQYRMAFGKQLGERIYLIIQDRIEREESAMKNLPLTGSPIISPVSIGSPIIIHRTTSTWKAMSEKSQPINISGTSTTQKAPSESNPLFSPLSLTHSPPMLFMSGLDLNESLPILDFKKSDMQSKKFMKEEERKNIFLSQIIEQYRIIEFMEKHPPLLWQNEHLNVFLSECVQDSIPLHIPDVDDFIFMTPTEINNYFPERGELIYSALRSRFINPEIKKFHKSIKIIS